MVDIQGLPAAGNPEAALYSIAMFVVYRGVRFILISFDISLCLECWVAEHSINPIPAGFRHSANHPSSGMCWKDWGIVQICIATNQPESKIIKLATRIIHKKVKVQSETVSMIKEQMSELIKAGVKWKVKIWWCRATSRTIEWCIYLIEMAFLHLCCLPLIAGAPGIFFWWCRNGFDAKWWE